MNERVAVATVAILVLSACGSKTALSTDPPRDSGVTDGFVVDSDVPDTTMPGLAVECPRMDQYTTVRLGIDLAATVNSTSPVVSSGWTLTSAPTGSMSMNAPVMGERTSLVPDMVGEYALSFSATNEEGLSGSCDVFVHSVVGPPVAICPEGMLTTGAGEPLELMGDAFDDVGVIDQWWDVVSGPGMASIDPYNSLDATFIADVPGDYVVSLTVLDGDMAMDTCSFPIRVTAPPMVFCPMSPIMAPTRQSVTITARADDETGIDHVSWELMSRPDGSSARLRPTDAPSTRMTPDRQGSYLLVFTAFDTDGLSASCEVEVIGTPTPPECSDTTVDTHPLTETEVTGMGVDDGSIVGWRWRLVGTPDGSAVREPSPRDAMTTRFTPDIAGEYRLELTVTDDDGESGTCVYLVRAIASEGLRIEMNWETDGTDMDTHLLRPLPEGMFWFQEADCHWQNCNEMSGDVLEWGAPGPDDNPRLDLDDTDGLGPENINIDVPQPGVYRVGVHAWGGVGRGVRVRIYCGGSTTMPRQTFGPVTISERRGMPFEANDFWRVADVEITAAGTCRITELLNASGDPDIVRSSVVASSR